MRTPMLQKVKFPLEQTMKAQTGNSDITLLLMRVGGQRHFPAALPSG